MLGLVGVLLAFAYPFWALYLLVCLFFFPMDLGEFSIVQVCGALTVLVGFASHLHKGRSLRAGPFLVPMLCFGVVMVLSLFYALALQPVFGDLHRLVANTLIYLLVLILAGTPERLRHMLGAFLLAGTSNAAYGLYTTYSSGQFLERASGFVGNANHLGFICAFAALIAFHRYAEAGRRQTRLAYLALCGVLLGGVTASASRGATVSLLAGMLLCAYQLRQRLRLLAPVILIVIALLPLAPKVFFDRVSSLGEDVENSTSASRSSSPRAATCTSPASRSGRTTQSGASAWATSGSTSSPASTTRAGRAAGRCRSTISTCTCWWRTGWSASWCSPGSCGAWRTTCAL
jgi:uncharacterized membrane protein YecN with MAPEG domain